MAKTYDLKERHGCLVIREHGPDGRVFIFGEIRAPDSEHPGLNLKCPMAISGVREILRLFEEWQMEHGQRVDAMKMFWGHAEEEASP